MPNDVSLLPPKNQQKHLDKTMISLPSDFRHLAHVGPKTPSEIENIRNSDNVIDAVNEVSFYVKPSSSNNTLRSVQNERVRLDDVFPAPKKTSSDSEVVRGYENQPTSHQYVNVVPLPPRKSTKKYKAPPPPPSQETKPSLMLYETPSEEQPVVFRSISKNSNLSDGSSVPPSPMIFTPERIEPPKPNSVLIERPGDLGSFSFGLDDCIPITKSTSPLKTLSPIHRPLVIPKDRDETPILSTSSPPNDYMSTIRSTSAQGKQILEDLDNWLDDLDDDDREKLSTISTDESGYPTLALEKDRAFMKHLVEKYELGVEPETVRLRKKKAPAPRLPPEAMLPPFAARPVSMPPNRPPPSYDAPSFDAPIYEPASGLLNGRALTKQNALDLRSSGESPALDRFLNDKRFKSSTMPLSIARKTTSSGFTDVSTTSSRSDVFSNDVLSTTGEEEEELTRCREIEEVPIPKPRTMKSISSEPLIEEEESEEMKTIGEEFEVVEKREETQTLTQNDEDEEVEAEEEEKETISEEKTSEDVARLEEEEEDDELIVTRF